MEKITVPDKVEPIHLERPMMETTQKEGVMVKSIIAKVLYNPEWINKAESKLIDSYMGMITLTDKEKETLYLEVEEEDRRIERVKKEAHMKKYGNSRIAEALKWMEEHKDDEIFIEPEYIDVMPLVTWEESDDDPLSRKMVHESVFDDRAHYLTDSKGKPLFKPKQKSPDEVRKELEREIYSFASDPNEGLYKRNLSQELDETAVEESKLDSLCMTPSEDYYPVKNSLSALEPDYCQVVNDLYLLPEPRSNGPRVWPREEWVMLVRDRLRELVAELLADFKANPELEIKEMKYLKDEMVTGSWDEYRLLAMEKYDKEVWTFKYDFYSENLVEGETDILYGRLIPMEKNNHMNEILQPLLKYIGEKALLAIREIEKSTNIKKIWEGTSHLPYAERVFIAIERGRKLVPINIWKAYYDYAKDVYAGGYKLGTMYHVSRTLSK